MALFDRSRFQRETSRFASALLAFALGSHARAAAAWRAAAPPPAFPDGVHVVNGCHLSTVAYLAKFRAVHPEEEAWPLTVTIRSADGHTRPHTIALLTWRGAWWGRDEYFGVFALDCAVGDGVVTEEVARRAERRLDRHSDERAKALGLPLPQPLAKQMPVRERAREIAQARALLPFAAEQFWVNCGREEIPFLLFRPAPRQIAVYDPLVGTVTAEIDWTDGARIVGAVAFRLGYPVTAVRADVAASPAQAADSARAAGQSVAAR